MQHKTVPESSSLGRPRLRALVAALCLVLTSHRVEAQEQKWKAYTSSMAHLLLRSATSRLRNAIRYLSWSLDMLRLSPLVWFASLVLSAPLATAQTREAVSGEITVRGTVETVDVAARIVRIRGDQGNVVTVNVPAAATRLNEYASATPSPPLYYDRVVIRPKPADEPTIDRTYLADHRYTRGPGAARWDHRQPAYGNGDHYWLGCGKPRGVVHGAER